MMMNDLLKIQSDMGSPKGQTRPDYADDERFDDEVADDINHWPVSPTNYNAYHVGYTTKHWLMVFRAVETTV